MADERTYEVPVDLGAPFLHVLAAYQATERLFNARQRAGKPISDINVSTMVRIFDNIIRTIRRGEDLPFHPKFKVTFSPSLANYKEFWDSARVTSEEKALASDVHQFVADKLDALRANSYDSAWLNIPRVLSHVWSSIEKTSAKGKRKQILIREATKSQRSHYYLRLSPCNQPWMMINTLFTKRMKKNGWSFVTDDYGCMNLDRNPIPDGKLLFSEFTCLLAQLLRDLFEPKRAQTKFPGAVVVTAGYDLHARVVSANLHVERSTDPEHGDTCTVNMHISVGRTVTFPDRARKDWTDLDTANLQADMTMLVFQMTTGPGGLPRRSINLKTGDEKKPQPAPGAPEKSGRPLVSEDESSTGDSVAGSVFSEGGSSDSQEDGTVETKGAVGAREG